MIDVDLQDPPELIEQMYSFRKQGYDTVLAKRKSKKGENIIRNTGSLKIGLNGIFSFSTKPLHYITISSALSLYFL